MEVTYQKVKTVKVEPPPEPKPKQEVSIAKEKQIRRDVKVLDKESDHFTVFDKEVKDISKFSRPVSLDKKRVPGVKTLDGQRKTFVELVPSEKIQNPVYNDYHSALRSLINAKALQYIKTYVSNEQGYMRISFIVSSLGELKGIRIIEQNTQASDLLKEMGLRSVQDSFPFRPFPKNLPYPELTFSIRIVVTVVGEEMPEE
ncbi:MAG: hypothetical protein KC900_03865 [Candidatus Omnitrophica bacterium]|nr:hypothetical protein [Candidatus Omnitrophota bacterium]